MTTLLYALDSAATEKLRAERARREQAAGSRTRRRACRRKRSSRLLRHDRLHRTARTAGRRRSTPTRFRGVKLTHDLVDAKTGKVMAEAGDQADAAPGAQARRGRAQGNAASAATSWSAAISPIDIINEETGEVYVEAGDEITAGAARAARAGRASTELPVLCDRPCHGRRPISATRWRSTRTRPARKR